jgi:hypothetical protein
MVTNTMRIARFEKDAADAIDSFHLIFPGCGNRRSGSRFSEIQPHTISGKKKFR